MPFVFPGDVKIDHILLRVADLINADIWRRRNIRRRRNSSLCVLREEPTSCKLGLLYRCTDVDDVDLQECEGVKQCKRQHLSHCGFFFWTTAAAECACGCRISSLVVLTFGFPTEVDKIAYEPVEWSDNLMHFKQNVARYGATRIVWCH